MRNEDQSSKEILVEDLYKKYYKILRTYSYQLHRDKDMAEDIVQDVFVELWKNKEDIVMEENIKSYLFRSVYTKVLNYRKSMEYTTQEALEHATEDKIQQIYLQTQQSNPESDVTPINIARNIYFYRL